jgi:hypothetical protein
MHQKQRQIPEWLRMRLLGLALILFAVLWALVAFRLFGHKGWVAKGIIQDNWLLMGPGPFSFGLGVHLTLFGNYFFQPKIGSIAFVVLSTALFILVEAVFIHHYVATGRL